MPEASCHDDHGTWTWMAHKWTGGHRAGACTCTSRAWLVAISMQLPCHCGGMHGVASASARSAVMQLVAALTAERALSSCAHQGAVRGVWSGGPKGENHHRDQSHLAHAACCMCSANALRCRLAARVAGQGGLGRVVWAQLFLSQLADCGQHRLLHPVRCAALVKCAQRVGRVELRRGTALEHRHPLQALLI